MNHTLLLICALAAGAQAPAPSQPGQIPVFTMDVVVVGSAVADFSTKMDAYATLRAELEKGLPALKVTNDPKEIVETETKLAIRIREARRNARRGDIFTPTIREAFRQLLRPETTAGTCEQIRDDNPGEFFYAINATYPKNEPVSTMPARMLDVLPRLPADVEYRFLGRDLILHDLKANVILDRMEEAYKCPPKG